MQALPFLGGSLVKLILDERVFKCGYKKEIIRLALSIWQFI